MGIAYSDLVFAKDTLWIGSSGFQHGYSVHVRCAHSDMRRVGFIWRMNTRHWIALRDGEPNARRGFLSRQDAGLWLCQPPGLDTPTRTPKADAYARIGGVYRSGMTALRVSVLAETSEHYARMWLEQREAQ